MQSDKTSLNSIFPQISHMYKATSAKVPAASEDAVASKRRFFEPLLGRLMATDAKYDVLNPNNALRWFRVALQGVEDGKHDRMREALRNLQNIVLKRGRNSDEALHYLLALGTVEKNGSVAAGMLRDECEDVVAHTVGILTLLEDEQRTTMRIANASVHGLPPDKAVEAFIDALSELFVNSAKATQTDGEKIGHLFLIGAYRKKLELSLPGLPESKFPELRQKAVETIGAADLRVADLQAEIDNAMQVNAGV